MWSLSPGQAGDMQPPSILDSLHRAEILSIGDDLSRTFAVSFPPRSPAKARNIPGKASVQLGKIALDLLDMPPHRFRRPTQTATGFAGLRPCFRSRGSICRLGHRADIVQDHRPDLDYFSLGPVW